MNLIRIPAIVLLAALASANASECWAQARGISSKPPVPALAIQRQVIGHTVSWAPGWTSSPFGSFTSQVTAALPQFDPGRGTLVEIRYRTLAVFFTGSFAGEYRGAALPALGLTTVMYGMTAGFSWNRTGGAGPGGGASAGGIFSSAISRDTLEPGGSGCSQPGGSDWFLREILEPISSGPSVQSVVGPSTGATFSAYIGTGSVPYDLSLTVSGGISGWFENPDPFCTSIQMNATGMFEVLYIHEPN